MDERDERILHGIWWEGSFEEAYTDGIRKLIHKYLKLHPGQATFYGVAFHDRPSGLRYFVGSDLTVDERDTQLTLAKGMYLSQLVDAEDFLDDVYHQLEKELANSSYQPAAVTTAFDSLPVRIERYRDASGEGIITEVEIPVKIKALH